MKSYTRKGDRLSTGLADGTVVSKRDERIHLLGSLDELNSHVGLVRSLTQDQAQAEEYISIQRTLLQIRRGVSENVQKNADRKAALTEAAVTVLENKLDQLECMLPGTTELIPGGSFYSAQIDVARTVAERCERWFAAVAEKYPVDEYAISYINRLSDYLYMTARAVDAKNQGLPLMTETVNAQTSVPTAENRTDEADAGPEPVQVPPLEAETVLKQVQALSKRVNNSYGTFYTFCVCDTEGKKLATNSPALHSVAVHESLKAAGEALKRAKRDGESAAVPAKSSAAIYVKGRLLGTVGVYGSNEKANNEKIRAALDVLTGIE